MRRICAALLALGILVGVPAQAAYPERPVTVIVPFPAGQTTDIMARALAAEMSKVLKQPMVIDNRGGAGGIIGIGMAKIAPNDGYTVLIASSGPLAINENLYKDIPYHTLQDFEPVAMILDSPQFLVTRTDFPVDSVPALIDLLKKEPGKHNYGSGGVGLTNHLTMEMLRLQADLQIWHVPYRGAQAALMGLVSGDTDLMFESGPAILPFVEAHKLKILAVGARKGSARFPEVRSVAAQGLDGFDATTWMALLVPKGTPRHVIETLNKATNEVLSRPAIQQQFLSVSSEVHQATPEATRAFIDRELTLWKGIIEQGGIKAE